MDRVTAKARSIQMARIKSKDTRPELAVRRLVFAMGFRYRLHRRDLPGTPDLVFVSRKKVIFVNGCFWHSHAGCRLATTPKSRLEYWLPKLTRNVERDRQSSDALQALGWSVLVVWECQIKKKDMLKDVLKEFLNDGLAVFVKKKNDV